MPSVYRPLVNFVAEGHAGRAESGTAVPGNYSGGVPGKGDPASGARTVYAGAGE